MHVFQGYGSVTSSDASDRNGVLSNEVGVSEDIHVVDDKPQQGKIRVGKLKIKSIVPIGIESVVRDRFCFKFGIVVLSTTYFNFNVRGNKTSAGFAVQEPSGHDVDANQNGQGLGYS